MNTNTAYDALAQHFHEVVTLDQVSGLLSWDQETMMSGGASAQRAEWISVLEKVNHTRRCEPRVGDWLDAITEADLTPTQQANIRLIRRDYERRCKVSDRLVGEIARVTSQAQLLWAKARQEQDFSQFQSTLSHVVDLRREEAAALADGGNLYDALLDQYEVGITEDALCTTLGNLRDGLVDLRGRILDSAIQVQEPKGQFSRDQQIMIARELATVFGYDWSRGRLDFSTHPFSSGSFNDVRITTRISEEDPFNCFYSTIHEVGHAVYDQGINQDYGLTMLGAGASMGVHESQSRFLENQLGRSRAFTGFLFRRMRNVFGDFGIADEESFYHVVNKVKPGFIRTESDEVQYNLHVLMRFDLERQLFSGALEVVDLEEAWNNRFKADFGCDVDNAANGVLQDVHWSLGLFGYFPTYSLGNIYAGELYVNMSQDLPDLHTDLGQGNTKAAVAWLGENIHQHGSFYEPQETIRRVVGHEPTSAPLLSYLNAKFGEIYQV